MSNISIELSRYLPYYESFLNRSKNNITYSSSFPSDIEPIKKTNFAEHYHFLCKKCGRIPKIRFLKNKKIKYKCYCSDLSIDNIHTIYDYLDYSDIIDIDNIKLKCENHPDEKYSHYCIQCGNNLCNICKIECINHKDKIIDLNLDEDLINKRKYIIEKIKVQNQTYIDEENLSLNKNFTTEDDDSNKTSMSPKDKKNLNENYSENNNDNGKFGEDETKPLILLKKKDIITNVDKDKVKNEFNSILDKLSHEDEDYYLINLYTIIVDDYQNYPNYELIKIISDLEKFIFVTNENFKNINLEYEFEKEDIDIQEDYSVKIFGKKFVENNKEKCFLVVNEMIMDINNSICLKDIYDNFNLESCPIKLNVELVERPNNKITDLSFMFGAISNLKPNSNFNNFDSIKVTKTKFMFLNCLSITELPDISNLNFSNVTDMRHMFSGCKSLKKLPDISKWDTNKLYNIEGMFENCESLTFLPDISNWNKNHNIILKRN